MKQILLDSTLFCGDNLLPILLGLLGAALLGYLLKHFMGGSNSGNDGLQAKYDKLSADLETERARSTKLQEDNKKKNKNVAAPMATAVTTGISASEADQLNSRVKNLKEELRITNEAKIKLEGDVNAANLKAKEANTLTSEIETLKTRIEGLTKALDTSKVDAERYKTDFESANSERAKLSANLASSDAGALQKRIDKLEIDLNNSRFNVSNLQVELDRAKHGTKTVNVGDKAVSNNVEELKAELASNNTELTKLKAENERLAKAAEMVGLTKIAAANEAYAKSAGEISDLKSKLQYAEARASRLEEEKTKLATNVGASNVVVAAVAPVSEPKIVEAKVEEVKADAIVAEEIVVPTAKADDLTVVEGIGPKIAELINNKSITTYAQLADTPINELKDILDEAGDRFKIHNPGTWAEQAALLRDGKMDEFKALCAELDGGVRVEKSAEVVNAISEESITAAKANPDDLKVLEGVGPVLEGVLNSGGIYTYNQLASMTPAEVKAVLEASGDKVHDPASWPQQAILLRDGKMEEFEALCEQLKGGRM